MLLKFDVEAKSSRPRTKGAKATGYETEAKILALKL